MVIDAVMDAGEIRPQIPFQIPKRCHDYRQFRADEAHVRHGHLSQTWESETSRMECRLKGNGS